MNDQIKYGLLGAVIGGIAVWFFMTTIVNSNNGGMMNSTSNSQSGGAMMGNIDQHFIEQMIPHHEDAISMSKVAQTKAQKPEVKQLAKNIIESQGKEITQMKSWYKEWFKKEVPAVTQGMMGKNNGMHGGMMGDSSDMTKLEGAADFDKAFAEEMITHHQMALMMTNMLKGNTNRPEMQKLADEIITTQTQEIELMRGWLKEWGNE